MEHPCGRLHRWVCAQEGFFVRDMHTHKIQNTSLQCLVWGELGKSDAHGVEYKN